jgi:flagellar hook-associated protein 1 FlgK
LFTYSGGPSVPGPVVVDGLAAAIRVNASVDPRQGGDGTLLRDGGISDPGNPAYVYNSTGAAGFGSRLRELVARLDAAQSFDPQAQLKSTTSVKDLAVQSGGWLEGERKTNSARYEDTKVVAERALAVWQNRVGINLDDELTALIALERSYQASSRLITTVNSMFDAVLNATR